MTPDRVALRTFMPKDPMTVVDALCHDRMTAPTLLDGPMHSVAFQACIE